MSGARNHAWARVVTALSALAALWCLAATPARAWEPFRSANAEVEQGNAELAKNQLDKALAAYNDAAKRLPQEPGVHLDRGIALLKSGKLNEARSALQLATQGSPSPEVRAKAQYNLGLSFMQEADAAAKQEDLEGAQKLLREAGDAFKGSLRAGPGNRDAAWNYELAKRRQVELEKKQQEKKDQEKKDQEEKKKDEEQKKNEEPSDPNQDKDKQDESKDPSQQPDAGTPQGGDDAGAPPEPQRQDGGQEPEPKKQEPEPKDPQQPQQGQPNKDQQQLPEHMQKALDALEDNDDSLQKQQAAQRARQRPQRVEKDW